MDVRRGTAGPGERTPSKEGRASSVDSATSGTQAGGPGQDPPPPAPPGAPESAAQVAAAYDDIAAGYDELVAEDSWMRERLWAHYLRAFRPGDRVLDVACGTGLDTLHLAAHGLLMTGIDLSPGMVEELRRKAAGRGLAGRVEARVADAAGLDGWPAGSFDGVISSFAGLNTADLAGFAAAAARLVRPRGRVIVHLLAPAGLWERLRLVARGRVRQARSLAHRREVRVAIAGRAVRHALLPAAEAYRRCFAADFALRGRYGLGWLWPRRLARRLPPRALRWLGPVDAALGRLPPWRAWGRFFVLDLERRPPAGPQPAAGEPPPTEPPRTAGP
jgi:SAM-dependent methyltransferase